MSTRASRETPGRPDFGRTRRQFAIDRATPFRRDDPRKDHPADRPNQSPALRGLRAAMQQRGR